MDIRRNVTDSIRMILVLEFTVISWKLFSQFYDHVYIYHWAYLSESYFDM